MIEKNKNLIITQYHLNAEGKDLYRVDALGLIKHGMIRRDFVSIQEIQEAYIVVLVTPKGNYVLKSRWSWDVLADDLRGEMHKLGIYNYIVPC